MQLGSFLASRETMYSPRSIGPWMVHIVESCWTLVNLCLLTFPEVGKGSGNSAPKLADRWKFAMWRETSRTSIWSEPTKELKKRDAYDESLSTAGQKKTFKQLSKHHRNRSRRQWTSPLQPNLSLLLLTVRKRQHWKRWWHTTRESMKLAKTSPSAVRESEITKFRGANKKRAPNVTRHVVQ